MPAILISSWIFLKLHRLPVVLPSVYLQFVELFPGREGFGALTGLAGHPMSIGSHRLAMMGGTIG